MKNLLIGVIRMYQRYLSPLKRKPTCKYVPSCSQYAVDAIAHYGVFMGLFKSCWRLLRCQPFGSGGYDPAVSPPSLVKKDTR